MSFKEALSAVVSDRLFLSDSDRSRAALESIREILPKFENDDFEIGVNYDAVGDGSLAGLS